MDAVWLHNIFSWSGVVKDSFIPNKRRSSSNSRFRFIMYETIREARAAVRATNGALCLHSKLFVKLAEFGWKRSKERLGRFIRGQRETDNIVSVVYKPMVENVSKRNADNRTFAEVVAGVNCTPKITGKGDS